MVIAVWTIRREQSTMLCITATYTAGNEAVRALPTAPDAVHLTRVTRHIILSTAVTAAPD